MPEVDLVESDRRFFLEPLKGCWCFSCRFVLLMKTWLLTFTSMVLLQGLPNDAEKFKKYFSSDIFHNFILGTLGLLQETPGSFNFSTSQLSNIHLNVLFQSTTLERWSLAGLYYHGSSLWDSGDHLQGDIWTLNLGDHLCKMTFLVFFETRWYLNIDFERPCL